jgi:ionotropic glutamate receptor
MAENPSYFVNSTDEGIARVLKGNYAFFMESANIDYNVQKDCNLTQIGGLLDYKGYGIGARRGSPYTKEITLKLLKMQEKGQIQIYYNRWWKGAGICNREEKKEQKANPLGFSTFHGIFVVLITGLILAVFVSIIEFIYYAKKNSHIYKVS